MENPFLQIGAVLILATLLGIFIRFFKQPLILTVGQDLGGKHVAQLLSGHGKDLEKYLLSKRSN